MSADREFQVCGAATENAREAFYHEHLLAGGGDMFLCWWMMQGGVGDRQAGWSDRRGANLERGVGKS